MKALCLLVLLMTAASPMIGQQSFTMAEAIQYGLENNNLVKRGEVNLQESESQIREYKSIGIPTVSGTVGYQYFIDIPTSILPDFISPAIDGRLLDYELIDPSQVPPMSSKGFPAQFGTKHNLTAGLDANFLLFDGSFFVGLRAIQAAKDLVIKRNEMTERDVRLNITKAYLAVLNAQKNGEIVGDNISNLENTLRETTAIFESGFAEKLDVERLQLSLDNLKRVRERIIRFIELSENLLKFQMSYPIVEPISLTQTFESIVDEANADRMLLGEVMDVENRVEFQILNQVDHLQSLNLKRWKFAYLPVLKGYASYSQSLQRNELFDKNDNDWFPVTTTGLNLEIPIFDGFYKRSQIELVQVALARNAYDKQDFQKSMNLEVSNARIAYIDAQQNVESTERSLRLAEKIYNTTQIKYREGVGSSVELTQDERELYDAQANHISALYDLIVAYVDLKNSLGKI